MILIYKQLTKQVIKNKIFVFLLLLLCMLTSLVFFFVKFSVDGNISRLDSLSFLTENQQLYKNALNSNTQLAYIFHISFIALTAFVFSMFLYRFFRTNKKHFGCMKALGFKDNELCLYFVIFAAFIAMIGNLLGMAGGYYLSDILIKANKRTYMVTDLIKGVSITSIVTGFILSTVIFCITALFCYSYIRGKETGILILDGQKNIKTYKKWRIADALVNMIPSKYKFPFRIALRKPLAILLIIIAIIAFIICMVLGYSLNMSSQKIFISQTVGHNYEYDTHFSEYRTETVPTKDIKYLDSQVEFLFNGHDIVQNIVGLYNLNNVYELKDLKGNNLSVPKFGTIYINSGIAETYNIKIGDVLNTNIAGKNHSFTVAAIATNAKSSSIYADAYEISTILGVSTNAYNGILSISSETKGGVTITKSQNIDNLKRNSVSNKTSAIINQVIGCVIGCLLIFLAVFVNFQDNTHDMLILEMMGYKIKEIRKLFIDVYYPIILALFIITLIPGVLIAKSIQKSISIAINDYIPFGINIFVILMIFIILNIIYWMIQNIFTFGIKRIIANEEIAKYT